MRRTTHIIFLLAASLAIPAMAGASGWVNRESPRFDQNPNTVTRSVDQFYEIGKALYQGKVGDFGKIKYCVAEPDSDVGGKLRGKTVKPYKLGNAYDFADKLYDCKKPASRIVEVLPQQEMFAVLYYLNKRYKMEMTISPDQEPNADVESAQKTPEESG